VVHKKKYAELEEGKEIEDILLIYDNIYIKKK